MKDFLSYLKQNTRWPIIVVVGAILLIIISWLIWFPGVDREVSIWMTLGILGFVGTVFIIGNYIAYKKK